MYVYYPPEGFHVLAICKYSHKTPATSHNNSLPMYSIHLISLEPTHLSDMQHQQYFMVGCSIFCCGWDEDLVIT